MVVTPGWSQIYCDLAAGNFYVWKNWNGRHSEPRRRRAKLRPGAGRAARAAVRTGRRRRLPPAQPPRPPRAATATVLTSPAARPHHDPAPPLTTHCLAEYLQRRLCKCSNLMHYNFTINSQQTISCNSANHVSMYLVWDADVKVTALAKTTWPKFRNGGCAGAAEPVHSLVRFRDYTSLPI